ncbi:TRAP transporter large permease [Eubacteriales bacterium DFI.9.88]|uniref:TRAP transporter large permease n=1 Tax=Hominibacterium faecale TaxID=2839743 RepID=UPI0022B29970|nr:TRAP transporter large permease [Hominibacterium faecale]MDE8734553.1 TRAP transporter large permease [Eubacteriales bacterium DFI.9.88]
MDLSILFYVIIIVGILLVLMATGTWISFALFGTSVIALMFLGQGNMQNVLESTLINSINSYTLVAMPLFIFMGEILILSGCSDSLFKGVKRILGPFPGGMLHTNIVACSIFAACSGSSTATTVAVGGVSIPELDRQGYAKGITLGSVCAGGTLGVLIPPSIMMILYGSLTGNSIGQLFIAGIIPGILLGACFILYIAFACIKNPHWAPPRSKFGGIHYLKDLLLSLKDLWPIILLIGGIMGSIYGGIATPTEAGAVAVLISLALWGLYYKTMTKTLLLEAIRETILVNAQLMISIVGARCLGMALSLLNIPSTLSTYVANLPINEYIIWAIIIVIYIVLGCLVDGIDLLVISVPVFYPIMVNGLGFDPIWFGVTLTVLLEMSLITPPVGFNLYVTHSISGTDNMMETIKGTLPFVIVMFLFIWIMTAFPILATFLPSSMQA